MRVFLFLFLVLFACKKAEDRSCVKFTGDSTEKIIPLDYFYRLHVGPYLDYVLVQDTVSFVKLIGGENVLNLIDIAHSPEEKQVVILNKNKCRFLRSKKKKITAEIHFSHLEEILFEGSGRMTNVGKINVPYMVLVLNEGSGTVDLNLESKILRVSAEPSWANFKLKGHTENLDMAVKGNAYGDTRGLAVDSLFTLKARSSADTYVNVDGTAFFRCETWGNGNIYYTGAPLFQEWNNYGEGQLLKID